MRTVLYLGMAVVFIGLSMTTPSLYGQDASSQGALQTASGTVQSIDWVAGKIVVETADYGNADEVTFIVPEDAQLTSGTDTMSLSDIEQGDQVQIQFVNTLGGLVVKRLVDGNQLNDTV